jgi:hypothetical protein
MPIVSSTFVESLAQKDGRKYVTETHTDHLGLNWLFNWLANAGLDPQAAVTARGAALANQLRDAEIDANVAKIKFEGSLAAYTLNYSTATQNFAALREAYKTASKVEAIMIGDFLAARTDAQLQSLFGMTAAQVTTLRTNKLTPAANAAATIRATTGA